MRIFKRIVVTTFALMPLLIGITEQAGSALVPCPSGSMCLYENSDFGGEVFMISNPLSGCYSLPSSFNDRMSSVQNLTPRSGFFNADDGCADFQGGLFDSGYSALTVDGNFNDRLTSIGFF